MCDCMRVRPHHLTTQICRVKSGQARRGFAGGGASALLWLICGGVTACATTPPQLKLPEMAIAEPAFQASVEAFSGAPIIGKNRVDILLNGEQTFPALLQAIRSAMHTLTFEAYIFHEGKVANQLVDAFVERCRAGVRISILLDAHGSKGLPDRYITALRDAGCSIVPDFRPLRAWQLERTNKRNHRRVMVVDGRIGFTGGYGLDDTWDGDGRTEGRWRETNVRLEGPVVHQLQAAFLEHWRESTGELLGGADYLAYPPAQVQDGPVRTQVVRSSPLKDNFSMYGVFLQAISSARSSIFLSTPYLMPGPQFSSALIEAVQRGVMVRVLVPSVVNGSGVEYVTQASQRDSFGPLLEGGIQLFEYAPALLHTKMMVIDGCWATVGSTNLDNRSMALNDELNVVFYDQSIARRLEDIFNDDLTHAKKISAEQLEQRGWISRVLGFLTSPVLDYF
jgi:cardiolipin synthase A/B